MEGRKGEARRERIGGRWARERASEPESRAPPSLFLLALSSPLSKVGIGYEVSFGCDPWTDRGEGTRVSSVSLILVRVAEGRSYPSHSEVSEAASIHAPRCSRVLVRRLSGQGGHEDRIEAVVRPRASVAVRAMNSFSAECPSPPRRSSRSERYSSGRQRDGGVARRERRGPARGRMFTW